MDNDNAWVVPSGVILLRILLGWCTVDIILLRILLVWCTLDIILLRILLGWCTVDIILLSIVLLGYCLGGAQWISYS